MGLVQANEDSYELRNAIKITLLYYDWGLKTTSKTKAKHPKKQNCFFSFTITCLFISHPLINLNIHSFIYQTFIKCLLYSRCARC